MGQLGGQVVSQFTTRLGAFALEGQSQAEGRSSGPTERPLASCRFDLGSSHW